MKWEKIQNYNMDGMIFLFLLLLDELRSKWIHKIRTQQGGSGCHTKA